MKGELLLPDNTVGKHCQPKDLILMEDADGNPVEDANGDLIAVGVKSSAFFPDNDGVSVGWLEHEHHVGDRNQQICSMVNCICNHRKIKRSHRLALLPINAILRCGNFRGAHLWVEHDPIQGYECHSLICGIDPNEGELIALIATEILSLEVMLVDP